MMATLATITKSLKETLGTTCQGCVQSKGYDWRYVQLVAPGMGKMPSE
jgi:hypothetical protein